MAALGPSTTLFVKFPDPAPPTPVPVPFPVPLVMPPPLGTSLLPFLPKARLPLSLPCPPLRVPLWPSPLPVPPCLPSENPPPVLPKKGEKPHSALTPKCLPIATVCRPATAPLQEELPLSLTLCLYEQWVAQPLLIDTYEKYGTPLNGIPQDVAILRRQLKGTLNFPTSRPIELPYVAHPLVHKLPPIGMPGLLTLVRAVEPNEKCRPPAKLYSRPKLWP